MRIQPGDVVALRDDDRAMVVVAHLDSRMVWVSLNDPSSASQFAFRDADLRLIRKVMMPPIVSDFATVPQIGRAAGPSETIAA